MSDVVERESMEFDVVIVGAGPAGLSAACRLMQCAAEQSTDLQVCVVEKGSEVGAHILSGAILEPRALDELFPQWSEMGAPVTTTVTSDEVYLFTSDTGSYKVPHAFVPNTMHNTGNYVVSLGSLCRWLALQAEELGVEVFPGFAAAELIEEDGVIKGIVTGDMGLDIDGKPKGSFMPGMELRARYTLFVEGCRGHLGKQLIAQYALDESSDAQHYGLGIKELWDIDPDNHKAGLVMHGAGWPLGFGTNANGGSFLYHAENNQLVLGLIVDLSYANPHLSPFDEFQRMKHHPLIKRYLKGGKRISYGARAITKGGINALPKMHFPGGLLIGCDAGTLNFAKIKGTHTAMKSGMVAAETVFDALAKGDEGGDELYDFDRNFKQSWAYKELHNSRNFGPALHKYGTLLGGTYNFVEQNVLRGKSPLTLREKTPDHEKLGRADDWPVIDYRKPDGVISFDKLSSVFLSNTNHEEGQPCHLKLENPDVPLGRNQELYAEPAQRYCPAGVYEVLQEEGADPQFHINAQNCIHCKTCDIKDPSQNITWVVPEGGGGPNYPNM